MTGVTGPSGQTGVTGPIGPTAPTGELVDTDSIMLAADMTTAVVQPTEAVLMTLLFTTVQAASILNTRFSASLDQIGAPAVQIAANFRLYINGVLRTGTVTNIITDEFGSICIENRLAVVAGVQTVEMRWTRFGPIGQTMRILVATSPTLYHANMICQEQLS